MIAMIKLEDKLKLVIEQTGPVFVTTRLWVFPELVSMPPEGVYQRLMLTL